jgi:hypothetical protein
MLDPLEGIWPLETSLGKGAVEKYLKVVEALRGC